MITEARRLGIATTIARQERYGQLSEDKKIQGATAVAANKIIFQLYFPVFAIISGRSITCKISKI